MGPGPWARARDGPGPMAQDLSHPERPAGLRSVKAAGSRVPAAARGRGLRRSPPVLKGGLRASVALLRC